MENICSMEFFRCFISAATSTLVRSVWSTCSTRRPRFSFPVCIAWRASVILSAILSAASCTLSIFPAMAFVCSSCFCTASAVSVAPPVSSSIAPFVFWMDLLNSCISLETTSMVSAIFAEICRFFPSSSSERSFASAIRSVSILSSWEETRAV